MPSCRDTTLGLTHEHLEPLCAALAGQRRLPFGLTTPSPHCAARLTQRRLTLASEPQKETRRLRIFQTMCENTEFFWYNLSRGYMGTAHPGTIA